MEFTKLQIAGLVLGYLKSEKCFEAFDQFLQTCSHFEGRRDNIKMDKFYVTRVIEKCLTDFLDEYANIYTIVQGRLEASNYYNEKRENTTLVDRLLYLLDLASYDIESSTPIHFLNRQVQATSAESLPGNADSNVDSDLRDSKTPKRRNANKSKNLNKCLERNEAFDVSEILTQTLLENHELHEKLAETINIVRNTPALEKAISEEQISAGASRELDAIIKTVVQRTEEDPMYNKMLEEIIGTSSAPEDPQRLKTNEPGFDQQHQRSFENPPPNSNQEKAQKPEHPPSDSLLTMIDDQNNHAVQSIIAASQTSDPHNVQPPNPKNPDPTPNSDVFVFDGTLDTYLKTSAMSNPTAPTNPVYINAGGGLIMVPQEAPKQFFIVNNQPCIKNVLTDSDIMAMPTIIVNDEAPQTFVAQNSAPATKKKNVKAKKAKILPKLDPHDDVTSEFLKFNKASADMKPRAKITITRIEHKEDPVPGKAEEASKEAPKSPPAVPTLSAPLPISLVAPNPVQAVSDAISAKTTASPRQAGQSHVRNLNFATPVKAAPALPTVTEPEPTQTRNRQTTRSWDADLRKHTVHPIPEVKKSLPPKRKRPPPTTRAKRKPKPKAKSTETVEAETIEEEQTSNKEPAHDNETIECENNQQDERIVECSIPEDPVTPVSPILSTPRKDGSQIIPKTPGAGINFDSIHCTPFNDVLDEQLKGIDLISLPTPKIPITPGFSLTPYNNRPTDYSTSSSYYQPSDNEQCKSIGQLIEESEKPDNNKDAFANLRILCDTVNNQPRCETESKLPEILPSSKTKPSFEQLKKFNQNVIGKKNLNLLNQHADSSSPSDSSDSESDKSEKIADNTVICRETVCKNETSAINNIISKVELKSTLTKANLVQHEENQTQEIRNKLELVRQRTVKKIKEVAAVKKPRAKRQPKPKAPKKVAAAATATARRKNKKAEPPPVKSPSKDAAEELVEGLWERGIHLMPNKGAPPSKAGEEVINVEKAEESVERVENKVEDEVDSSEPKFDTKIVAEIVDLKDGESDGNIKKISDYNLRILTKRLECTVFVERLNQKMDMNMACTAFETLMDLPALGRHSESSDLMDFALTLDCKSDTKETKQPPAKGTKRRRPKVVEDDKNISNKKTKSVESSIKLLNKIDVDMFLDKVHGE